jgi:hypothetical protein
MTAFVSVDDRWAYRGQRIIVLENDCLRLEVMPDLGAKLFRFVDRATSADLLWHNPRVEPRAVPIGASYDDNFSGGWDELFPNDAPGRVGDEVYPDHGELWCQPWEHRVERRGEEVELYLSRAGASTPTLVEKWITLGPGHRHVRFRHRITNTGMKRLDFLWKLHPALEFDAGDRIDIPGSSAELVDPDFGRIREPRRFRWPVAQTPNGAQIDFSVLPAPSDGRDFLYVRDLSAGWCALRRLSLGIGFGLAFPKNVFTSVWLFMTYGGWRGLRTVVLEPCTAYPKDLAEAIRAGTCSRLEPGASLECEVCAVAFAGAEPVRDILPDGTVVR